MSNSRLPFSVAALALSFTAFLAFSRAPQLSMSAAKIAPQRVLEPRVLMVGGGPDFDNNQVAIESNVRYLNRLLPPETPRTLLFADGKTGSETVLFDQPQNLSRGEYLYRVVWEDDGPQDVLSTWRRPNLGARLDGASRRAEVNHAFVKLARDSRSSPRPILLYFTGHGSRNDADLNDNFYDLWNEETLSVRDLSAQIARLPKNVAVNLVMVQCFSGAFANLIFAGAKPGNRVLDRDIAGFFATTCNRVAAGCTSEVDEAEYHDFTSYFFAALTGRDRVGRKISGADFNRDGRVGGDEAFYYTVAYDKSIDVPVATSDIFLRRFVPQKGSSTRYSAVFDGASAAQKFALEKLSGELKLSGENRLVQAQRELADGAESWLGKVSGEVLSGGEIEGAKEKFEALRHDERARLLKSWPNLKSPNAAARKAAQTALTAQLALEADDARWKALRDAVEKWGKTRSGKSARR